MRHEDFAFDVDGERLAATRTVTAEQPEPSILALHGFGTTSTRHRISYLLDAFAEHGHASLTFEFSGNGDSTGVLTDATLRRRRNEALAAADRLGRAVAPVLLGTSMGAHLAASIVPEVRPRALVLFCPAAYPEHAADLPFDGSLPKPGNYPDSPAYAGLRDFDGDLLIIGAGQDQVVHPAVIDGYLDSAGRARSAEVLWLKDSDHFVHRWLPGQQARLAEVQGAILRLLPTAPAAPPRS
ncbi:alpha/beta hydrolase [Kitasatospora acidiphila]|uniref:Alpha/beta hydrolase n=1 Tax=Kitasatospora acidiphila TaxID=2567942 RepID=A0A540VYT1_9ACTN|nr:alpha/beta hydrolase family protein [Kitasatospora acidiphila]TQF01891.1 alpha/beta hydrolase [Kitasatospora acidiphila]